MSQQNLITESDVDTLVNLLLRSQQSRTREALCFSIGIDPKRLSFLRDSSDSDFFLLLIEYLNQIGDQKALCKLCYKELVPIFNKGIYSLFLSELAGKLNCSQELRQNHPNNEQPNSSSSSPAPSVRVSPINQPVKNKLVIGSAIFLIGLVGVNLYEQLSNSSKNSHPKPSVSQTPNPDPTATSEEYSHPKPSVSQTPNPDPTATSEEYVNYISSIYQKKLGRKPTTYERISYINLLETGVPFSSILDWISKTSSLLQEGNVISLECQGDQHTAFKWLDSRIKNNTVSLGSNNIDPQTKWKVRFISNGVIALENQGKLKVSRWLYGLTKGGSINLAPNTEGVYKGTKWRINIIGDRLVALENQGEQNDGLRWLNGKTYEASVSLAPNTDSGYTGTKWTITKQ